MLVKTFAVLALTLFAQTANAVPVTLTWLTTLGSSSSIPGSTSGESITTILTVDNGGTSLDSQTWLGTDFLSYRVEGANGWWAESNTLESSVDSFITDAAGIVTAAGNWAGGYFSNSPVLTSWAGAGTGGWWNNGLNEVFCLSGPTACVFADNVGANQDGTSWTAALGVPSVPVPATLPLLLAGIGGLAALRRKTN